MKPKFVLGIFLAGMLAVGAIVFHKKHLSAPAPEVAPVPVASIAPAPAPAPVPAPAPAVVEVKKAQTPEEHEAAINAEIDRLSSWEMKSDPQSLSNILGDLKSPEKEIRMAAIEAAKQFESPDAIPALKAAAANTEDNQEAIAMLEAADWLALPDAPMQRPDTMPQLTPDQIQAQNKSKADAAARRQTYLQTHGGGQNSPSAPSPNSSPAAPGGSGN